MTRIPMRLQVSSGHSNTPPQRDASFPLSLSQAETPRGHGSALLTEHLLDLINAECGFGPISRQFIPTAEEFLTIPIELDDPIGDKHFSPVNGLIHRHSDRVLLLVTDACPAYCRFCFRCRPFQNRNGTISQADLRAALQYIREHKDIWEVILSGGDPFTLSVQFITDVMAALDAIKHVEVVRIHTRTPVSDPTRITPVLVSALKVAKPVFVVLHCNHICELHEKTRRACARFIDAGIPMLSQTVLLRGVNDDVTALRSLMRELVKTRIKPYYLHHVDLAPGTSHFRTTLREGQALMHELRRTASGLCQPQYVLDIPGGYGKIPIGRNYVHPDGDGPGVILEDPQGHKHAYPSH